MVVTIQNAKAFPRLSVLLDNRGRNPVNIWDGSNSWGWDNLSFCAILADGKTIHVQRKESDFTKNGPTNVTLRAGERITREVRLDDEWWTVTEQDLQKVKYVSAIYSVEPTTESTTLKVWTGLTVSPWYRSGEPDNVPSNWTIITPSR